MDDNGKPVGEVLIFVTMSRFEIRWHGICATLRDGRLKSPSGGRDGAFGAVECLQGQWDSDQMNEPEKTKTIK